MAFTAQPAFVPPTLRDVGEDDDFVYVIGLRESTDPESWSLLFMEPDDDDLEEGDDEDLEESDLGTYCLVVDPGQATHYGGVIECEITETRLRLKLTTEAARDLAMPTDVTFTLELPAGQLSMLKHGLTRVLTSGRADAQPALLHT